MSILQQTISHPISLSSIGLHSGQSVFAKLLPAPENQGIIFRRTDCHPAVEIKACVDSVRESLLCTELVQGNVSIRTVEHLMAAFSALEIDNLTVELNTAEAPVMDGSAEPIAFALESAGIVKQSAARRYLRVRKTVRVEDGDKFAQLSPYAHGLRLDISINFPHPLIQAQSIQFILSGPAFINTISRARTFGQVRDLESLHQKGLALGASFDNAVGLSESDCLNPEGLRYPDEFVRHKLLDAIGDLYMAGPIRGHFESHKAGHALTHRLLTALLADPEAWEYFE